MAKSDAPREIKNPSGDRLSEALAFVAERLELSSQFVSADPYTDEWQRWLRVTVSGVTEYFGDGSEEFAWSRPPLQRPVITTPFTRPEQEKRRDQSMYNESLSAMRNGLQSILDKHEVIQPVSVPTSPRPEAEVIRAFVSHGGMKPSLDAIERFLRALGVDPIVVERESSEGREVQRHRERRRRMDSIGQRSNRGR